MGIIKGNQDNFEELTSKGTVLVFHKRLQLSK